MKQPIRIVFMGTASFAVPTLELLMKSGLDIAAVVTAPDKPAGRGRQIRYSPVKEFALENHLTLMQPERLRDESFAGQLRKLKPDLQLVVAFRMLPETVWKIPPLGTINLHASLLPQYRGAAPINHAIIQGEKVTGLTTFMIDEEIDTGRILKQVKTDIGESETAGEVHDRMMIMGADLTLLTIREIIEGAIRPIKQEELLPETGKILPAPKIFKENCEINWNQPIDRVYDFIRGLSPLPGAFTTLLFRDGSSRNLKIFRTAKIRNKPDIVPGKIRAAQNRLDAACTDGYLTLTEVQIEGKRKMQMIDFLNGIHPESITGTGHLKSAL